MGVNGTNFELKLGATLVPAVVSYNRLTRVATLNPRVTLAADRVYTVTMAEARDAAGTMMAATTWSFTTGPTPAITATVPTAGATAVRRYLNITTTFSEAITGFAVRGKVRINRVTVTGGITGVRDLAGNPLTTRRWTFTTGAR